MKKMAKEVKETRQNAKMKKVTNFMGGVSFEINPLDTLKIVTASSIFGEPAYYRNGEFAEKTSAKVRDGIYRIHDLVKDYTILDDKYAGMKTSEIMEKVIDEALDYDFEGTIRWALELRKEFYMRLNPQVIMVRAAMHPKRKEFNEKYPGVFREINKQVMSRLDEPISQLTYWLYRKGSKNKIPSILKRSWADRIEKADRYEMFKYKNAGIGLIDTIRICHASSELVDELMRTGTIKIEDESKATWEKLRSEGKTWKEIISTLKTIPHMALLKNLRGIFTEINDVDLAKELLEQLKSGVLKGKQFPFRYYTAYQMIEKAAVNHKSLILDALEECIDIARDNLPKLKGKTMCLSDNSGSAWGTFNSEYGKVTVAEIDNLSSVLTAQNSDEGYVGVFGDRLEIIPISKRNGALTQTKTVSQKGEKIGMSTEHGIWLFFDQAIKNKEHWDNIFIYSDQQAGHGGLYGHGSGYVEFALGKGYYNKYFDVMKMINKYRAEVNPKVNVFSIQTAGYTNVVIPESIYRGAILYGWTGKESLYASELIKIWDEIEQRKNN